MTRSPRWRFAPAAILSTVLLLLVMLFIWLMALGNRTRDGTVSLSGTYTAHLESPGSGERELELPTLFKSAGISGDSLVSFDIPVTVPPDTRAPALLLDRVRYGVEISWDGAPVPISMGSTGSPEDRLGDASVLALLPSSSPGEHILTLRIQGAFGEGGLLGDIRFGEWRTLVQRLLRHEVQVFGLCMALLVQAAIQLVVVLRRPDRREHLYFALLFLCLGLLWFTTSDTYYQVFGDLGIRLRLRRAAYLGAQGFVVLWAARFAFGHVPLVPRFFATATALLAMLALLWPDLHVNAAVNTAGDLLAVVAIIMGSLCLLFSPSKDNVTLYLLAVAALLSTVGTAFDVFLTRGVVSGSNWVVPVFTLVVVTMGAAQTIKQSDDSTHLSALLAVARDGVLVTDRLANITQANEAARAFLLLEESPGGLIFPGKQGAALKDAMKEHVGLVVEHGSERAEFRLPRIHGELWLESVGTCLGREQVLLVLRDITDRRKIEDRLKQAARMETIRMICVGLASDFRKLMGSLMANISALQSHSSPGEQGLARLGRMEAVVGSASTLTDRLLSLPGVGGGGEAAKPVDPVQILDEALSLFSPGLSVQVSLEKSIPENLPMVLGDSRLLVELLLIVLTHAADAIPPEDGRISITAGTDLSEGGGLSLWIIIDHNGSAPPPQQRVQLFDLVFLRNSQQVEGIQGLAVAQRIVKEHGGDLTMTSSLEGGVRFRLLLPTLPRSRQETWGSRQD